MTLFEDYEGRKGHLVPNGGGVAWVWVRYDDAEKDEQIRYHDIKTTWQNEES